MSFLPIIILLFLFLRNGSLSSLLQNIDIDGLKETLESLGIDNKFLNCISNETIESVKQGDYKALLPLLPTLLSLFNTTKSFNDEFSTSNEVYEELNPIKDIASEVITSSFGNYFK